MNESRGHPFANRQHLHRHLFHRPQSRRIAIPFALALAGICACLGSCTKGLTKSQARNVTVELIAAAQQATAHKSEITIRPEPAPPQGFFTRRVAADDIYVTLSDPGQLAALRQSLGGIASRHQLSVAETVSGGVMRFDFASGGTRTQSVHAVTPLPARARPPAPRNTATAPRLAIILDDLGHDRAAANSVLALSFPLTVSVLPNLPLSADVAEEAYRRGDQVLLQLPMEAMNDAKREAVELRVGMNTQQVQTTLAGMLETVPRAIGVNNHQGSRATSDPGLMDELMPGLRRRNLFFIDSRTIATSVAFDAAQRAGVPAAARSVFLDDDLSRAAILAQLELAVSDAAHDGSAIAIGHPHPETIEALTEGVPRAETQGIQLVFASDLVR